MNKPTLHVTPEQGGWAVKVEGEERWAKSYPNKIAAVSAARQMVNREGAGSVTVHRSDGSLESLEVFDKSKDLQRLLDPTSRSSGTASHLYWDHLLQELSSKTGESQDEVIRKALALYKVATEAVEQGKAVGIANDPNALESEFVGF